MVEETIHLMDLYSRNSTFRESQINKVVYCTRVNFVVAVNGN